VEVLGPAPAVFPRLKDRYRFQILIKGNLGRKEKSWLAECLRSFKAGFKDVDVVHDVDPVSMY
jgi:primosomal protein N' (replication factor Y)